MKKFFNNIEEYICAAVSLVLLIITFVNVLSRYVFHASIAYTDEITTNLFVLLSVCGTAVAVKRKAHLGLTILTDALPKKLQGIVAVLIPLVGAGVGFVLFYTGCLMVANQVRNGAVSLVLMIPAWIYGIFLPIGMLFVLIRFLQQAVAQIRLLRMPEGASDDGKGNGE